jgi:uncharacterized protein DUF481
MKKLLSALFLIFISSIVFGQDTLRLNNGNEIYGEIKSMKKAVLVIETPYSDSDFTIEWGEIKEILSSQKFLIVLSGAQRPLGSIRSINTNGDLRITLEDGSNIEVKKSEVTSLDPLKSSFLGRMSAALDIGYYFAKSNNLKQFTTNAVLGYKEDKWTANASLNVVNNSQDDAADTKRTQSDLSFKLLLKRGFYGQVSSKFLSNEEQQLDLRSSYQLGIGKFLLNSNSAVIGLLVGSAFTNEKFINDVEPARESVEAFGGLEVDLFDIGDFSMYSKGTVYPNLTEKGRLRAEFLIDLKYDLPYDFYVKTSYNYTYDNQPVAGATKGDFILQMSFGWEL